MSERTSKVSKLKKKSKSSRLPGHVKTAQENLQAMEEIIKSLLSPLAGRFHVFERTPAESPKRHRKTEPRHHKKKIY